MAQTKAIVDKLLTQASSAYYPPGYVSESVLPLVVVTQKTGLLAKYGTSHLRIETTISGGRGAYRRVESVVRSSTGYSVDSHGLEDIVTPDDYSNVESPYQAEEDIVMALTNLIWLRKEKGLADTLTSSTIMTQNATLSGTSQFSDYLNSDPLSKFSTARSTIYDGCGALANIAIMDWKVYDQIKYHPQLVRQLGYADNRPGGLNEIELASALGVEKVLIAKARYESANEGQTSSLASVWGKHIVFAVAPSSAGLRQVSLGYRVQLSRAEPRRVYKYVVNNPPGSTGIICEDHFDYLISNVGAGYLLKDVIA